MDYDETDLAQRYEKARQMPEPTKQMWLDTIGRYITCGMLRDVLDVGRGPGRFSVALADSFEAEVIAMVCD